MFASKTLLGVSAIVNGPVRGRVKHRLKLLLMLGLVYYDLGDGLVCEYRLNSFLCFEKGL